LNAITYNKIPFLHPSNHATPERNAKKTHQKNVNWNKKKSRERNIKNFTFQFRLGNLTLLYASIVTKITSPTRKKISHPLSSPEGTFANTREKKAGKLIKKAEKDTRKIKVENGIFIIINLPSIEQFRVFFIRGEIRKKRIDEMKKIHRNVICFVAESTIDTIFFTYLFFNSCHLIDGAATNNPNPSKKYFIQPHRNRMMRNLLCGKNKLPLTFLPTLLSLLLPIHIFFCLMLMLQLLRLLSI